MVSSECEQKVSGVGSAPYFTGTKLKVVSGNVLLTITAFSRPSINTSNLEKVEEYSGVRQKKCLQLKNKLR